MNVSSMTGFGKSESTQESCLLKVEVKSVNNRYRDIRFKLPHTLNYFEPQIRKMIDAKFKRGSIEVSAIIKKEVNTKGVDHLDFNKVNSFINNFCEKTKTDRSQFNVSPTSFLRNEFYIDNEGLVENLFISTLETALIDFDDSRKEEGAKLAQKLLDYLGEYDQYFQGIKKEKGSFSKVLKSKIEEKFKEFKLEVDDDRRFSQEIIYYLEKADIDEEIVRIESHLEKLKQLIELGGEVGRKIDFFVQELNRETNTIGSKSISKEISNSVIEMKARIEKIREQALNLE